MVAPRAASSGTTIRRGDVWWVDFEPTQGAEIRKTRPAVVITADALNRANAIVRDAIDVDDFTPAELTGRASSTIHSAAAAE